MPFVTSSFLFLVVRPGAPSSVLTQSQAPNRLIRGCLGEKGLPPFAFDAKRLDHWDSLGDLHCDAMPVGIA